MEKKGLFDNFFRRDRKAVALRYDKGDSAPKVVASGSGHVADTILKKAEENEVPVHEDKELVETLSKIQIGDSIPPELYEVVAEVLVFVQDMDRLKEKI